MLTEEQLNAIEGRAVQLVCPECGGSGYIPDGYGSGEFCPCRGEIQFDMETLSTLLAEVRRLREENERLRCCGNCRHLIIDIGETYWDCRAEGDSTEMWKSCSAWEERDEVD